MSLSIAVVETVSNIDYLVASAQPYPLAQFEMEAMLALRSLAQRHLSQMRGSLTAAAIDPADMVTEQMEADYIALASSLWDRLDNMSEGFGLDTLPWAQFAPLIQDAISSSRNTYIDVLRLLISKVAETPIYGEFFLAPDYIPGTGKKPPADYLVQFGDIRSVLGELGGGGGGEVPLASGISGGRVYREVLAENGISAAEKLWLYGETARRTFNGHLQMDGLVFSSWEDDALNIAPQDRWLRTLKYRPGDHWGCACVVVPYVPNFGEPFTMTLQSSAAEFACHDKSCAPPPVGTGGSDDYQGSHRPNSDGPQAHDLTGNEMVPADVYDHPEWYTGYSGREIRETMTQLRAVRGNPNAELTIYRALPSDVSGSPINPGDWVTLSKSYAMTHLEGPLNGEGKIASMKVPAHTVRWAIDDLMEFGYYPDSTVASAAIEEFYSDTQPRDREGRWVSHRGTLTSLAQDSIERAHGKGLKGLFPHDGPTTTTPWPSAPRMKGKPAFDSALVAQELAKPPVLEKVDPRLLYSTQPGLAREHVAYYLTDEYQRTGRTSADQGNSANAFPVVYVRKDGRMLILTGHHRAAAALASDTDLEARMIRE